MSEQDDFNTDFQPRAGGVIAGVLLVAAGIALLLDRTGALPAPWRISIWPLLLIAFGVAQLTIPRRRGRRGLFFILAGAWWLAGTAGWLSLALTWPLLIVAAGASIVLQVLTTPSADEWPASRVFARRHHAGGWILPIIIVGAVLTAGSDQRIFGDAVTSGGQLRAVSVMGHRSTSLAAAHVSGGEMVTIMGANSIDLHDATVDSGAPVTLNVFGLMGTSIITVPEGWVVDVQTVPVMGNVVDNRADWSSGSGTGQVARPASGQRLVLRGTVIMGRLVIRS